jgi:hypothetical protein
MILRYPLLALAGALAAAGQALAGGRQPVDTYLAITGLASDDQARAGELRPPEARVTTLGGGGGSAVVYYTVEGAAFRVVTTLGTDHDGAAAPVRLVSYLAPGQKAEVAVAGAVGTAPAVLELGRVGDRLVVRAAPTTPQG